MKKNIKITSVAHKYLAGIATCMVLAFSHNSYADVSADQFSITVDKYNSPFMGANLMLTGLRGYQAIDDIVASSTVDNTSTCMTAIRFFKWLLLDVSVGSLGSVIQHEYFGHGARGREFHLADLGYHINLYTGKTTYSFSSFETLNVNQQAAFSTGGVEATNLLAQQIEQNWVRTNTVDSRAATMYLITALDQSVYAFSTVSSSFHPDNDANAYIAYVNQWQGKNTLTSKKLKTAMIWDWIDPMLYISGASIIQYIWQGQQSIETSSLHIGTYRFMPTTHVLLAPYGPEFQLQAHLVSPEDKYVGLFLRYGRTGGKESYGFDLNITPLSHYDCWYFINKLSGWYQPHLMDPATAKNKYGFGEFAGVYYNVSDGIYFNAELGYKVSGYLPGTPLARGVVWRVGFMFDLNLPTTKKKSHKI
jgi:hypothetical protein